MDTTPDVLPAGKDQQPEICKFGLQVYNQAKRAASPDTYSFKRNPNAGKPAAIPNATIYLDFDGEVVSNTAWNAKGTIYAAAANLSVTEVERIVKRVSEDFSPFDVVVTTDETIYQATNPYKRTRVIVTETWEWFGVVGGTAFNNSFTWGNNTPVFIFSTLLNYNEKFIAEAISHEVGHTLGLLHQADYDPAGTLLSEYNMGCGDGITSWAPIMGIGYYQNVTTWHKGPTVLGYNNIQDDVAIISNIIGLKTDRNREMDKSEEFASGQQGLISDKNDIDYYFIHVKQPTTITAEPFCLAGGEGSNLNLKMKIYDKKGMLLKTIKTSSVLSVSTTLEKEKYFVSIESDPVHSVSRYGLLGNYTLLAQ